MKGLAADFSFALWLLLDLAAALSLPPLPGIHPDARLRGMNGGQSRLPLYMMQLYRTMLTEDRARTPAARVSQPRTEDEPGLHDSVISLVAKSKSSMSRNGMKTLIYFTQLN